MNDSTSREDIRTLAERFRRMAEGTTLPEYGQLMTKAAFDLEQLAATLDSPARVARRSVAGESDMRPLMRGFLAAIGSSSA